MAAGAPSHFDEVFGFLSNQRDDVRKMAAEGIAAESAAGGSGEALLAYVKDPLHIGALKQLVELAHISQVNVCLGHVLSTHINLASDPAVAESLLSLALVPRVMKLLEALVSSNAPQAPALRQMTVMLLNNLTSSHNVIACDQLLQVDDEDMVGYFFSRMNTFFNQEDDSAGDGEDAEKDLFSKEAESNPEAKAALTKFVTARTTKRWYVKVCVNISRIPRGRAVLIEDDDWRGDLLQLMASKDAVLRTDAQNVVHNCAGDKVHHGPLVEGGVVNKLLGGLALTSDPVSGTDEQQLVLLETLAALLVSDEGMEGLESVNAKAHLKQLHEELQSKAREFLERHVLPFLDDIQDVLTLGPGATSAAKDDE